MHRNPESKRRPTFHQLEEWLNVSETELFAMGTDVDDSSYDSGCDHNAMTLGAPLEASVKLYRKLQCTYLPE